jgi:transcriptional regulator with XRE-family HTH domain/KaiC/GvpD/RAD55 family RecA-like ATPase
MSGAHITVSSGIEDLDRLLGGGIFIGDNVVWYDDAGSLAPVFCHNFIHCSLAAGKSLIYVNFDHSLRHLIDRLGPLADSPLLTIFDAFTDGKGDGAEVFAAFYRDRRSSTACRIVRFQAPRDAETVAQSLYGLHAGLSGDVRLVFDSLTGMQALWGDEEQILRFYSRACPRLYELNTIAYWIIEKQAHSQRLRARINQIAQVVIALAVNRGKTRLTLVKAEGHDNERLDLAQAYWCRGQAVTIDLDSRTPGAIDLGSRIRVLRTRKGLSQSELARRVGVTPSTISQVEHNQIYPSLPALYKMSEILEVAMGAFFESGVPPRRPVVFRPGQPPASPPASAGRPMVEITRLLPTEFEAFAEPLRIDIPAGAKVAGHFFQHKGQEMGFLQSGELILRLPDCPETVQAGDLIYLDREMPIGWENPGREAARLFWLKLP